MKKREAEFQTVFNRYIRQSDIYGAFELKQTRSNALAFDSVEQHQCDSLMAIEENGLTWKLSDADPREKPCDSIRTKPMDSWIVVKYPSCFVIIPAMIFFLEEAESTRKSLTLERAKIIATKIVQT